MPVTFWLLQLVKSLCRQSLELLAQHRIILSLNLDDDFFLYVGAFYLDIKLNFLSTFYELQLFEVLVTGFELNQVLSVH